MRSSIADEPELLEARDLGLRANGARARAPASGGRPPQVLGPRAGARAPPPDRSAPAPRRRAPRSGPCRARRARPAADSRGGRLSRRWYAPRAAPARAGGAVATRAAGNSLAGRLRPSPFPEHRDQALVGHDLVGAQQQRDQEARAPWRRATGTTAGVVPDFERAEDAKLHLRLPSGRGARKVALGRATLQRRSRHRRSNASLPGSTLELWEVSGGGMTMTDALSAPTGESGVGPAVREAPATAREPVLGWRTSRATASRGSTSTSRRCSTTTSTDAPRFKPAIAELGGRVSTAEEVLDLQPGVQARHDAGHRTARDLDERRVLLRGPGQAEERRRSLRRRVLPSRDGSPIGRAGRSRWTRTPGQPAQLEGQGRTGTIPRTS